MRLVTSATILSLLATTALAGPTVTEIKAPDLPLGEVTYPGGKTLKLNLGIGSAAWHDAKDPAGVVWTITDRGPNLDCSGIDKLTDISIDKLCAGDDTAKNFTLPDFTVTIAKIEIGADNTARLLETIPLKGKSGKPVSGLPFSSANFKLEVAYDVNGKVIPGDPSGLDTETLARLPDGSFIIGEEYGSSVLEIAADGTVLKRHVPAGVETELKGADYEVVGSLPAIIAKRTLNRGIENVAVSADGATLYVLMQSPLANPDNAAYMAGATPLDAAFDDLATSPSLEQLSAAEIEAKGIKPLVKTLVLNSDDVENMPKKVEGVAVMSPTEMVVISDSDFGIEGDETQIRRITFPEPVLQ